ncbi:MAG: urea ABC transporter substrate-binding protein [Pseudomonadales bacterium]
MNNNAILYGHTMCKLTQWLVAVGICCLVCLLPACDATKKEPIKVGVLHSLTGTMAISEIAVVDATLMAIEEINHQGGLLGRPIEAIVVDGKSDWPTFEREAERLIQQEQVVVVFGCWTSASRKTVRPVFEQYNHLLFYPVQYEGLESSPNIIYTGAAPNQQLIPAVKWSFDNLGKKYFLVGSDYIFPRAANAIIKEQIHALKGEVVGEEYLLLGSHKVDEIIAKIVASKPDVLLNTINGDTNVSFFQRLRHAGVTPDTLPTISFSIAEAELVTMSAADMAGDYAAWNYFQSIDSDANQRFVAAFKQRYGDDRVTDDPIEAAYFGVHIWAQVVADIGTADVHEVRNALKGRHFNAPEGRVYIDPKNNHTWKQVRIGKIQANGQFEIVWSSPHPIRPIPFPIYKTRQEWIALLDGWYQSWGKQWSNSQMP